MEGKIYDATLRAFSLPALLRWDISHGFCAPCDCFEVAFLYAPEMLPALSAACRFSAEHQGETVFFGVVDEFELTADEGGCRCTLRGRGMQALLLDSQAESAEYFAADTEFILNRHVRPFGVTDIDTRGAVGQPVSLTVSSGESHWSVVSRYAEFCLGLRPRFAPSGTLLLDGADSGRRFTVTGETAITAQVYGQDRYGVISAAIVKNRTAGSSVQVDNPEFQAIGGMCVRVISVPRKTIFGAMQHTAAYQIEKSRRDFLRCRLTVAECFAAFPGDQAVLEATPLGVTGEFTVSAARCWADGKSAGTALELRKV